MLSVLVKRSKSELSKHCREWGVLAQLHPYSSFHNSETRIIVAVAVVSKSLKPRVKIDHELSNLMMSVLLGESWAKTTVVLLVAHAEQFCVLEAV